MFLSYADFGFLGAGMKFASEYCAQNNLKEEIKIIGFTGYIFFVFVCFYAAGVLFLAFNPQILISSLVNEEETSITRKLLTILAIFSPVFVLQRIVQIIFAVRLKDYIFQRIVIISNIIKIIFAIIFFSNKNYPIVNYFLFSQICTLFAVLIGLVIVQKSFGYELKLFFKAFKFSQEIFSKTKKIAFVSIFLTICWILFYELDPFVISKLLGAKYLATFSIGFSLMEYFRSIFGIIFGPFVAKFNHFIGLKDFIGLHIFFKKVLILALPFTVFPVLAVSITIKSFIFSWVGIQYTDSVPIAKVLVLSFLFSFLSSPTGILIMAYEKAKLLYITNAMLPLIYWFGVFVTFKFSGLQAFADFKVIAFFIVALIYFGIITTLLKEKFWKFLSQLLLPAIVPILYIFVFAFLTRDYLPTEKSKLNLLLYFSYTGFVIITSFILYYFSSFEFKKNVNNYIVPLFLKIKAIS
jgi:O-antigen/teichoic acid export membrane protein